MRRYYENLMILTETDGSAEFYMDPLTDELVIAYSVQPNDTEVKIVKLKLEEWDKDELKDILAGDFVTFETLEVVTPEELSDVVSDWISFNDDLTDDEFIDSCVKNITKQ